jgi:hypothetical protein
MSAADQLAEVLAELRPTATWAERVPYEEFWQRPNGEWEMTMPPEDYACAPIFRWPRELSRLVERVYRERDRSAGCARRCFVAAYGVSDRRR